MLQVYIKKITKDSIAGFLVRENRAQIQVNLRFDRSVYKELLTLCQTTNIISVDLSDGVVVGVRNGDVTNTITISDFIISIINQRTTISKKELYDIVNEEYGISYSTFQKHIRDVVESNTNIHKNYNNIFVK